MQPRPAIAILTPGILTALGLKSILEKLIPMAEVDAFDDAQALEESGMERYFHFSWRRAVSWATAHSSPRSANGSSCSPAGSRSPNSPASGAWTSCAPRAT